MTARFFGEYLVQKGVVKSQALVSALIEQMTGLPPIAQLVFENKWLDADQLLRVFHRQQEGGDDFASACRSLGLWTSELEASIEEALKARRIPVGQILVSRGELDLKTLTRSLDDFLAQAQVFAKEETAAAPESSSPEPSAEVEAGSEESGDELLQPGIIAELEDMFDERKRKAVKVALAFLKDKNPPDSTQVAKLLQDSLKIIRTILGLVKIFGLTSLQNLLSEMERVIESRLHPTESSLEQLQHAADVVGRAMEEAWNLRESLAKNCTDAMYLRDLESKKRYDALLRELREIP